jgi:hypothetical protein
MFLITTPVLAHGPQMQITIDGGKIVTREVFADEPYTPFAPEQWLYHFNMAQRALGDANDGWYAQPSAATAFTGPGIATELGGFATGSVISLRFTDGLKIWNGSAFVDPGAEQIEAFRGLPKVAGAISSDGGPFNSFAFTAIANSEHEHKTARFRLLGDGAGSNTPSDDGMYLIAMQLATDQPGVDASHPFYFLLNKNASPEHQTQALAAATALVPEPSGALLLFVAGAIVISRRK